MTERSGQVRELVQVQQGATVPLADFLQLRELRQRWQHAYNERVVNYSEGRRRGHFLHTKTKGASGRKAWIKHSWDGRDSGRYSTGKADERNYTIPSPTVSW